MKKEIIIILFFGTIFPIISNAQDSKIENMLTPVNYKTLTTLIKNYDGKNNIIMSYGHYTNAFNPDNDINLYHIVVFVEQEHLDMNMFILL